MMEAELPIVIRDFLLRETEAVALSVCVAFVGSHIQDEMDSQNFLSPLTNILSFPPRENSDTTREEQLKSKSD